ncbi:MAG: sugar phosphate isomerase/epimerase family protein [Phycisphaerae bacterium]
MGVVTPAAWLASYRRNLKGALHAASADGFRAVHARASRDAVDPPEFGGTARRHLRHYLDGLGLRLDGLASETAGLGLADPHTGEERLDALRQALELCAAIGVRNASVSVGGLGDSSHEARARESLAQAAALADRYRVRVAIRGATEDPTQLACEVRRTGCEWLGVALDTASAAAPSEFISACGDALGAVYLRDARRVGTGFEETDFGQGDVDFRRVLAELEAAGFAGPRVIRRDAERLRVDALRTGREYIAAFGAAQGRP